MFNFHNRRYGDPVLDRWIQGLAEWLFEPDLGARIDVARRKYLSPEKIVEYEEFERDPF